jgi:hypothetical protein
LLVEITIICARTKHQMDAWTNKYKNEWMGGHAKYRCKFNYVILYLCVILMFTAITINTTVFKIHLVIYRNLPALQGIFFRLSVER